MPSQVEIMHGVGGAYLFRNALTVPVPEAAASPLKLFSVYRATTQNSIAGVTSFLEYVYNDVMTLTQVNYQEFNLFKSFGFNLPNGVKKRFTLNDIHNVKNVVVGEMRAGVLESCKLFLKLYLRVKNPERQVRAPSSH